MYYTVIISYLPRISTKHCNIHVFVEEAKISSINDESIEKEGKNENMLVINEKTEKKVANKSKYPRNERVRVS